MSGYKLHEAVVVDLDNIWNYLAGEASPAIASKMEDEFFDAFGLLSTQPDIGFRRSNLVSRSLRCP